MALTFPFAAIVGQDEMTLAIQVVAVDPSIGGVLVLLGVLMVAGLIVDQVSDGYVTRWVELNAKGKDPSMIGHARSIEDAINKFDEYALVGYPRGTVGPKAIIFTGVVNNVENSLLGLLYDMGLPMSALCIRSRRGVSM